MRYYILMLALSVSLSAKVCHTDDAATWTGTVTINGGSYPGKTLSDATSWVCFSTTSHSTTPVSGPPVDGDFIIVGPDTAGSSTKAHLLNIDTNIQLGITSTRSYWLDAENLTWTNNAGLAHVQFTTAVPAGTANDHWITFVNVTTGGNQALYELQAYQIANLGTGCSPVGNTCFDLANSNGTALPTTPSGRFIILPSYLRIGSGSTGYGALVVANGVTATFRGQGPIGDNGLASTANTTYLQSRETLTCGSNIYGGANCYFDTPLGDAVITANTGSLMRNYRFRFQGTAFTVCGAANNGNGLIRLTTCSPHNVTAGQTVTVNNVDGVPDANGKQWTAIVPNNTHIDLTGSTWRAADSFRVGSPGTVGVHSQIMGKPPGSANNTYPVFNYGTAFRSLSLVVSGADISYFGSTNGTGHWYEVNIIGTSDSVAINVADALIDHCGSIFFSGNPSDFPITFTRSYWTNTLSTFPINGLFTQVVTPANLAWDRVSFDKAPQVSFGALTLTNSYSKNSPITAHFNAANSSFDKCFIKIDKSGGSHANEMTPPSSFTNSYIVDDNSGAISSQNDDDVLITGVASTALTINGLVTELWGTSSNAKQTNGDFMVFGVNTPATVAWSFKHILIVPNPYTEASGLHGAPWNLTSGSIQPASGGTITLEHNTFATSNADTGAPGSIEACTAGALASLKSNLGFDADGPRVGGASTNEVMFSGMQTHTPTCSNMVSAVNASNNGGWNVTVWTMTGSTQCFTNSLSCAWASAATSGWALGDANNSMYGYPLTGGIPPGGNDQINTNPSFLTSADGLLPDGTTSLKFQRRVATWAVMAGWSSETGMTQQAFLDGIAAIQADPTLVADVYNWVRAGYAPTNRLYKTAHDNVAPSNGWIGAVAGTLCPSSYPGGALLNCNSIAQLQDTQKRVTW